MVNFYRLIVGVVLAGVALAANAFSPVIGYYIGSITGESKQAVCQAYTAAQKPTPYYDSYRFYGIDGNVCQVMAMANGHDSSLMRISITEALGCPANSTTSGSGSSASCACQTGYFEKPNASGATACVKPDDRTPEQLCGDLAMIWNSTLTPERSGRVPGHLGEYSDGKTVCHEPPADSGMPAGMGCKHKFTGDLGFQDDKGKWWVNGWSFAYDQNDKAAGKTGASLTCSLADLDSPKEEKQPQDCKQGYKGSVNGVDVCIEAWKGENEGADWTRTRDGSGGTTDTKTNIKCSGDQCTVTETNTTRDASGNVTGTNTTTTPGVDRTQYCAKNPKSSICQRKEDDSSNSKGQDDNGGKGGGKGDGDGEGQESKFAGSCGGEFLCEGDAIQCAIAKDQHKRACQLIDDESPESLLYKENKDKTGDQTGDLPGNKTEDISGKISSVDALGAGGAGLSDLLVTVMGRQISLPFSMLNQYLAALGNVLLAVSFLLAFRIISRG